MKWNIEAIEKLLDIFENKSDLIKKYKFKKGEVRPNNKEHRKYYWLCYNKKRINISTLNGKITELDYDYFNITEPNFFHFKESKLYEKLIKLIKEFLQDKKQ